MSYQQRTDVGSKRLLNLGCLDIRGEHFGSFDRLFWHLRQRDYSCSTAQMAALPLLRSRLAQIDEVRNFLHASLIYLEKIQHSDGSFDEWYPNERGWGGPTSYILDFAARTYLEFSREFPKAVNESLLRVINKAANFTKRSWEKDVLFNHVALSASALEATHRIDSSIVSERDMKVALEWLEENFVREEGWGREYGFSDPGYQTATLSFLSKAHELNPRKIYEELSLESLEYIKYFHYPDESFALGIGARETNCVFDFGAHYWSTSSEVARALSKSLFNKSCGLIEEELDDHYYVYRLLEISDCIKFKNAPEKSVLFSKNFIGEKFFEKAGIKIIANHDKYSVINLSKGGAFLEFDKIDSRPLRLNYGVSISLEDKQYSSFYDSSERELIHSENSVVISGPLVKVKSQTFSVWKNLLFRITMSIFGCSSKGAYLIKHLVRSLLTTKNEYSHYQLVRTFEINRHQVSNVKDELKGLGGNEKILEGGAIEIRYVPQSKYQATTKLNFLPKLRR